MSEILVAFILIAALAVGTLLRDNDLEKRIQQLEEKKDTTHNGH